MQRISSIALLALLAFAAIGHSVVAAEGSCSKPSLAHSTCPRTAPRSRRSSRGCSSTMITLGGPREGIFEMLHVDQRRPSSAPSLP